MSYMRTATHIFRAVTYFWLITRPFRDTERPSKLETTIILLTRHVQTSSTPRRLPLPQPTTVSITLNIFVSHMFRFAETLVDQPTSNCKYCGSALISFN